MQFLKSSNRAAVIRALALKKASNRSELASCLNLTKMAISNIVASLLEESILVETDFPLADTSLHPSNGRRPRQLRISDWSINVICINIRRYAVSAMLMDINGNTRSQSFTPLPEHADNYFLSKTLIDTVEKILAKIPDISVIGIGISSIGPLDIYKKYLLNPPEFRKICNLNLGELLEKHFHLPVFLDNDMNCSALAELYFGAGISHRDLVFLGFSTGVGAGIIMNEKILHGFGGFAGEVGHISVNPFGPRCPCGQNGCVELYTSGENVLKNVGMSSFAELNKILNEEKPPRFVLNCIDEYVRVMHALLVATANSYDPDIIILGDTDSAFVSRFIPELETYMNTHMLNHGYKHIRLILSALGSSAWLYGAGCIVFQRIFSGELDLPQPGFSLNPENQAE